jgi:hypothetical protein
MRPGLTTEPTAAKGLDIPSSNSGSADIGNAQLPVRHMFGKVGPRHEPVTLWFVVGERVAVSGQRHKLVSVVSSIDPDADPGHRVQARIIADMPAAMPQPAGLKVLGSALAG